MNKITIIVSGKPNIGKSYVLFLIKRYLKKFKFEVNFITNEDYPSENFLNKEMKALNQWEKDHITNHSIVELKEIKNER